MTVEMIMRAAVPEDSPILTALMMQSFVADYGERWAISDLASFLSLPGSQAVVAEYEGEPVGFAIWRVAADEAELLLLGIIPAARRQGFGGQMLDRLIVSLQSTHTLFLEVRETNVAALALYKRAGFIIVGRRPRYYAGQNGRFFDALTLSRTLAVGTADTVRNGRA